MQKIYRVSASVLVYTMVLVVLGVFMATVVLNVATELSLEYTKRNIEVSLMNTIKSKADLSMKYSRDTNNTGSGFIDTIGCPTNIYMSGATTPGASFSTTIRYLSGSITCQGIYNSIPVNIYFNSGFVDLAFAQYQGTQITLNSTQQSGTFGNPDTSYLSATSSYPLLSDGLDDNFDSDNFSPYSTGSTMYPDGYTDNDDDARRLIYGYIVENSGLYNIFWSNSDIKTYINTNTTNSHPKYSKLGNVTSGYLYLDINSSFRLVLYKISKADYDATKELIINQLVSGVGQNASIGYLQQDLSLSATKTGTGEYVFDFVNNDYALFIENTSTGALLFRLRGEQATTGSGIYINALKDQDLAVYSYMGSHLLIDDKGRLIGNQFEVFGLK